jgi:hypothetical protein
VVDHFYLIYYNEEDLTDFDVVSMTLFSLKGILDTIYFIFANSFLRTKVEKLFFSYIEENGSFNNNSNMVNLIILKS